MRKQEAALRDLTDPKNYSVPSCPTCHHPRITPTRSPSQAGARAKPPAWSADADQPDGPTSRTSPLRSVTPVESSHSHRGTAYLRVVSSRSRICATVAGPEALM